MMKKLLIAYAIAIPAVAGLGAVVDGIKIADGEPKTPHLIDLMAKAEEAKKPLQYNIDKWSDDLKNINAKMFDDDADTAKLVKDGKAIKGRLAKVKDEANKIGNFITAISKKIGDLEKEEANAIAEAHLSKMSNRIIEELSLPAGTAIKSSAIPVAFAVIQYLQDNPKTRDNKAVLAELVKKGRKSSSKGKRNGGVKREHIRGTLADGTEVKLCSASNVWVALSDFADKTSACKEGKSLQRQKDKQIAELKAENESKLLAYGKDYANIIAETIESEKKKGVLKTPAQIGAKTGELWSEYPNKLETLTSELKASVQKLIDTPVVLTDTQVFKAEEVKIRA